jgi:two-component system CheB/CheR fusion protein
VPLGPPNPSDSKSQDHQIVVATLAHEFNNPLAALLNIFYLIEAENTLTPEGQRYLDLAKQEVNHLARTAKSALNDVRGTETRAKADVAALLRSVVDFYTPAFLTRGIAVQAHYREAGDLPIHAASIRQVFSNLLLNAADAIQERGKIQVRLSSSTEPREPFRKGLRVTVCDNGIGISSDHLNKIFDPFFTTKGSDGTGLGLAFVCKTVERHGGTIRAKSCQRHGRSGSVFSIFLPFE